MFNASGSYVETPEVFLVSSLSLGKNSLHSLACIFQTCFFLPNNKRHEIYYECFVNELPCWAFSHDCLLLCRLCWQLNDLPSINDVTYTELIEIISKVTENFRVMFSWILGWHVIFFKNKKSWLTLETDIISGIYQLKDKNGTLKGVDTSKLLIANSGNDLPVRGWKFLVCHQNEFMSPLLDYEYCYSCITLASLASQFLVGYWSFKSATRASLLGKWCRPSYFGRNGKNLKTFLDYYCHWLVNEMLNWLFIFEDEVMNDI